MDWEAHDIEVAALDALHPRARSSLNAIRASLAPGLPRFDVGLNLLGSDGCKAYSRRLGELDDLVGSIVPDHEDNPWTCMHTISEPSRIRKPDAVFQYWQHEYLWCHEVSSAPGERTTEL